MAASNEYVPFRLFHMPCCGAQICWVNPRLPNHCPECGEPVLIQLKTGSHTLMDSPAWLRIETTFVVGQEVTFQRSIWNGMSDSSKRFNLKGKTFVVKQIQDVPEKEIVYDPYTFQGGVGHHQWLILEVEGEDKIYSGLFFEKE